MDYKIREVTENDLDEIQRIEKDSFPCPFSKRQFLYLYVDYRKTFFVAEKDKEVLGYIVGVKGFRKITIASIAVKENWRRKGIATKLINYLIEKVRRKVKMIELQVQISNKKAIIFYEKMGFIYKGILTSYYPNGEDAVLYNKKLYCK
jgi:ribosomal-protein-alanine N-acetyltransferase